jgi:hypothetical protein
MGGGGYACELGEGGFGGGVDRMRVGCSRMAGTGSGVVVVDVSDEVYCGCSFFFLFKIIFMYSDGCLCGGEEVM